MKRSLKTQRGFAAIEAVLLVVIVAIIAFIGWYVYHVKHTTDKLLTPTSSTSAKSTDNGTDTSGLQSDLNSINNSLKQTSNDSVSADNALNDQQSQINVPTN